MMFHWFKRWMKTEHEFCQEELSAFLDGQLNWRERSRVRKHLERCAACRRDLASLQQTVTLLRATPKIKPPRSFFIPASEKVKQRQWQRTRLAYGYLRMATAMATVLLVLVVSSDALLRFATIAPAQPMPAAVPAIRTFEAEPTPMELVEMPLTLPAARTLSAETPAAMPLAAEGAVPQPSPEPTGLALLVPPATGGAVPQETAGVAQSSEVLGSQAVPSQTFACSARAPAPPTASPEAVAIASPSVEKEQSPMVSLLESGTSPEVTSTPSDTLVLTADMSKPTGTPAQPEPTDTPLVAPALPEPTITPVPTTATPEPTSTPVPPTATPVLTQTPVPPTVTSLPMQTSMPTMEMPSPQPVPRERKAMEDTESAPSGLWAILHAARPALSWLEWALGILVALLLAITLWVRQAQRSP